MTPPLHDGLAQELAFIRSQTASMAAGMSHPDLWGHVAAAAERALEESRRAIAPSPTVGRRPLRGAPHYRAAGGERAGTEVHVHVEPGLTVAPVVAEALTEVVQEGGQRRASRGGSPRRLPSDRRGAGDVLIGGVGAAADQGRGDLYRPAVAGGRPVNVGCHNRGPRHQVTDDGRGFQREDVPTPASG